MLKGLKLFIFLSLTNANSTVFAVNLNHDRTGQIALIPFYTVNNNIITNFTVTNTTDKFKAIRVRILESRIGADLLNINLYLSPFDVWNATLRMNPQTGMPNLITEDESCTYPDNASLHTGVDLRNPYDAITSEDMSVGYIEIIEMGTIADGAGQALDGGMYAEIDASGNADGFIDSSAGDRSITAGLLHMADDVPRDCSVVADAWQAGAASASAINGFEPGSMSVNGIVQESGDVSLPYDNNHNAGLVAPSGGINAYGIMINVVSGAAFVEDGVHIDHYATVAQHYLPNDPLHYRLPSLASGDVQFAHISNAAGDGEKGLSLPLTEYDTGALQDISPLPSVPMGSNPLPIAVVLSVDAVSTPYFSESTTHGETDIILTFPMGKYGIYNHGTLTNDLDGAGALPACAGSLNDGIDDGGTVTLEGFDEPVHDYPHDSSGGPCKNAGYVSNLIPDTVNNITYYSYEEAKVIALPDWCDFNGCPFDPPEYVALQRRVNVIGIERNAGGNQSALFTPTQNMYHLTLDHEIEAGWVTISSTGYDYEFDSSIRAMTEVVGGINTETGLWTGIPLIGFSVMAADIGAAQLGETVELIRSVNRN